MSVICIKSEIQSPTNCPTSSLPPPPTPSCTLQYLERKSHQPWLAFMRVLYPGRIGIWSVGFVEQREENRRKTLGARQQVNPGHIGTHWREASSAALSISSNVTGYLITTPRYPSQPGSHPSSACPHPLCTRCSPFFNYVFL